MTSLRQVALDRRLAKRFLTVELRKLLTEVGCAASFFRPGRCRAAAGQPPAKYDNSAAGLRSGGLSWVSWLRVLYF